jgi:hypothetical protein
VRRARIAISRATWRVNGRRNNASLLAHPNFFVLETGRGCASRFFRSAKMMAKLPIKQIASDK